MPEPQDEPTIETHTTFQGKLLSIRVDIVALPQGRTSLREIVEHGPCVCIVPIDSDGNVILVRQYRKPIESVLLEIPAGRMEEGESPQEAALRELQEEIGHTANTLNHLGSFWMSPGFCTEEMHAFLATDLVLSSLQADDDENIQVVKVPLNQAISMIKKAEIRDAKSISALLMAIRTNDNFSP